MSTYYPNVTRVYEGRDLDPVPITEAFLDLEKAINGKVDRTNFEGEGVFGLRSFHRKSLTETTRSRQLIWQEPAVWVFFWRGSDNEHDHLGELDNNYTIEEASTRVSIGHDATICVNAHIEIESYRFSGLDQSNQHGSGTPLNLHVAGIQGGGDYAAATFPALGLTFSLVRRTPSSNDAETVLDSQRVQFHLQQNTAIVQTDDLMVGRTGLSVNLSAVEDWNLSADEVRVGAARDYYVKVSTSITTSSGSLSDDEVVYIVCRSLSRGLTATAYYASNPYTATSVINAP